MCPISTLIAMCSISLFTFIARIIITFRDQNRADFVWGENSGPSHCLGRPRLLHFIIFGLTEELVCVPYIGKKQGFHE